MPEETVTVEQLKKQRLIEHMEIALTDLQRYQSNPLIINSLIQLHDTLINEYNEKFTPKQAAAPEDEKTRPTINPDRKKETASH